MNKVHFWGVCGTTFCSVNEWVTLASHFSFMLRSDLKCHRLPALKPHTSISTASWWSTGWHSEPRIPWTWARVSGRGRHELTYVLILPRDTVHVVAPGETWRRKTVITCTSQSSRVSEGRISVASKSQRQQPTHRLTTGLYIILYITSICYHCPHTLYSAPSHNPPVHWSLTTLHHTKQHTTSMTCSRKHQTKQYSTHSITW